MIDRLQEIGSFGTDIEEKKRQVQEIQILSNLRHRKSFEDSSKSTEYFSKLLSVFALIQILIALFQFNLQAIDSNYKIISFILIIVLSIFILITISKANKNLR